MTHDPLCPMDDDNFCECALITKVRHDERQKFNPAWWSQEYHAGYRQGYDDAMTVERERSRRV